MIVKKIVLGAIAAILLATVGVGIFVLHHFTYSRHAMAQIEAEAAGQITLEITTATTTREVVNYRMINHSAYDFSFGNPFELFVLRGGRWLPVRDGRGFRMIEWVLFPNGYMDRRAFFGPNEGDGIRYLASGEYRMIRVVRRLYHDELRFGPPPDDFEGPIYSEPFRVVGAFTIP